MAGVGGAAEEEVAGEDNVEWLLQVSQAIRAFTAK